jgi:hypothetical protein
MSGRSAAKIVLASPLCALYKKRVPLIPALTEKGKAGNPTG